MEVQHREIDELLFYDNNAKSHPDDQVEKIARSISEYGFNAPVLVDGNGVIIAGHGRVLAARRLGLDRIPCLCLDHLSSEQARAYRIADNKLTESKWIEDILSAELRILQDLGINLAVIGFSDKEVEQLVPIEVPGKTDEDAVPPLPEKPETQKGDVYILGRHRLMCGDSADPGDLDRLLSNERERERETVHLLNMDPPYNVKVEPRSNRAIAKAGNAARKKQRFDRKRHGLDVNEKHKMLRAKDRPLLNDDMRDKEYQDLLLSWFQNAARVMDPAAAFYVWGGYANYKNYPAAMDAADLYLSQVIIWVKNGAMLTRKDFMGKHESCFYGWKKGAGHRFFGKDNVPDAWLSRAEWARRGNQEVVVVEVPPEEIEEAGLDVWQVKRVLGQQKVHLTEKPVELAKRAMRYSSKPGENVLDLFGGSGSTLIAAEQTNRRAFLMELDEAYCDVIVNRWTEFTGEKPERIRK